MQNQKTRTRILGIELDDQLEAAAVIGIMILFAIAAVFAWIAIDAQARS